MAAGVAAAIWHRLEDSAVEPAALERMALPLPDKPSIAVLPFENLDRDPEQDFWVAGITEALITSLSNTPKIFVIAHHSIATYGSHQVEPRKVAEAFGVRYVLKGDAQGSAGRAKVKAELFDALSGRLVWAAQFERAFEDLSLLQSQLTRKVVGALEVEPSESEWTRMVRQPTDSPEAYRLFREGLVHYRRQTKADNDEARRLFGAAAMIDSAFTDALCFEGFALLRAGLQGWGEQPEQAFGRAVLRAQAAIAHDPDHAPAYALLGFAHLWQRRHEESIANFETALRLEPGNANYAVGLGMSLTFAGQPQGAPEYINRARRLGPYYPDWFLGALGRAHLMLGRHDEAIAAFSARRKRNPGSSLATLDLIAAYSLAGQKEKARSLASQLLARDPTFELTAFIIHMPYKDPAWTERIFGALRSAGLPA